MDAVPWQLLPIVGPFGFAFFLVLSVLIGIYRALEDGRLQTRGQVDTQLEAERNVTALVREALAHERAARRELQEVARFTADTVAAVRDAVERWE